jgi:hypothetical protein
MRNQPRCRAAGEWIKKIRHTHNVIKKNEILSFAAKRVNPEEHHVK